MTTRPTEERTLRTRTSRPFALVQTTRTQPAAAIGGELVRYPVSSVDVVGYSETWDAGVRRARKMSGGRFFVEVATVRDGAVTVVLTDPAGTVGRWEEGR